MVGQWGEEREVLNLVFIEVVKTTFCFIFDSDVTLKLRSSDTTNLIASFKISKIHSVHT